MAVLALVRHGESEWNKLSLWTGWQDIPLTDKGRDEAGQAAEILKDIDFQLFYSSDLIRSIETLEIIKKVLNKSALPTVKDAALKERDYGEYTGKTKWQIKKQAGEEKFLKLRRGWDDPVSGGETLKDVYNRVVPYYKNHILAGLIKGKNILLVAHGNSIRALMKYLEKISDKNIPKVEIATGEAVIYHLDKSGKILKKEKRGGIK